MSVSKLQSLTAKLCIDSVVLPVCEPTLLEPQVVPILAVKSKRVRGLNNRFNKWCPKAVFELKNVGIHNLTDPVHGISQVKRELSKTELIVLSCGPKCIPTPEPISDLSVIYACGEYAQSMRRIYHKYNKPFPSAQWSKLDRLIRLPAVDEESEYRYARASLCVETYVANVRNKLLSAPMRNRRDTHSFVSNNFRKKVKSVCCALLNNPDILVKESDKNLGLCVLPRQWYVFQVLKLLNNKHDYVFVDHVPSVNDMFCVLKTALRYVTVI
jgi:hypothetical protein